MKDIIHIWIFALLVIVNTPSAGAQSTSFSYQGTLNQGGSPANGSFDFEFRLYDALSGGAQIGTVNTFNAVGVTGGRFTVTLSFGSNAFPGADRWIQISVRSAGGGAFTTLLPRQGVTTTPYAMTSIKAGSLTSTLSVAGGGTGAVDAATARSNLGSAASGANSDITSLTGLTTPLSVAQGGTGSGTANGARTSIGAAASGANSDITSLSGLATPLTPAQGGSGLGVGPSAQGQYLRSTGAGTWAIGTISTSDVPNLSGNYVDLTSNQTISGNKIFTGTVSGAGMFSWQVVTSSQTASPNRGYISDSADQVTITLPSNANVGDVIRINGLGTGGWRVMPSTAQSLITNLTSLASTFSLLPWTAREGNRDWNSVASSTDGTKLVATVWKGQIYTSTDSGLSWTARESHRDWEWVATSADGNKLVAVVRGGQIYTSTDAGVTWTPRESNRSWYGVASSADGNKLVAVVLDGQIYTSTDSGVTWTPRESNRRWIRVDSSADGNKLVALVNGGQIYTSTDSGITWTARASNRSWFRVASSADGTKLVATVWQELIFTSTDSGLSWTARESHRNWSSVASSADGNKLIAAEFNGQIYTSTDAGITWTARASNTPNRGWSSVASSADGNKLVAGVLGGQIYISTDAGACSENTVDCRFPSGSTLGGDARSSIEIVYVGNGRFLIVTASGNFSLSAL